MKGWISGWKAIASYMGRSVRTAKRYHYEYYMPVHRGPSDAPIAIATELDAWLHTFSELKKLAKENRIKALKRTVAKRTRVNGRFIENAKK